MAHNDSRIGPHTRTLLTVPARVALLVTLLVTLSLAPAAAQLLPSPISPPILPLAEASRRWGPEQAAVHEGRTIRVRGMVAAAPIPMPEYIHLTIQEPGGAGLTVQGSPSQLGALAPGQQIEVTGRLEERAGLPVLRPAEVRITGHSSPPGPQHLSIAELNNVANTGRLVTATGTVRWIGQNAGGEVLALGDRDKSVIVFYPWAGRKRSTVLDGFQEGDRVRVTGLSAQYCPVPPFDRLFEIIVTSPSALTMVSRAWPISIAMLIWALLALAAVISLWWWRERKLRRQRVTLREIMALSEDLVAAASMADIARRIELMPAGAFGTPELDLYLHSEGSGTLDRMVTERTGSPLSIPLDTPIGSVQGLVAICFRNRSMLAVRDLHSSPLIQTGDGLLARSAVVAPMLAQGELTGVLCIQFGDKVDLNPDFQLAVQHLANQLAGSLRLQDQQLMKEQLLRSEKMAAAGQLISGVAADLRMPLSKIDRISNRLLEGASPVQKAGLHDIASEAQRGTDLVDHLLSFSNMEKREPKPLDIHGLLARLIEMRFEEMKRKDIFVDSQIPVAPVEVWADRAQLEQALLTIMVHAEEAATTAPDRTIHIASRIAGSRVHISFSPAASVGAARSSEPDLADHFGFPVAQAILQSHGGDLRNVQLERATSRLELELPVLTPAAASGNPGPRTAKPARVMTALVVEPDVSAQRRLIAMLSARGHRAIPVPNAEEAADVVQRIPFDVMFCSSRLQGLNWVELFQRARRRVGVFGLLTDGYDQEAAQAFANGEGHALSRPVADHELDQLLGIAEVRRAVTH